MTARTCIDAGRPVVVALHAPGPRRLDVQRRTGGDGLRQTWSGTGADGRAWHRTLFGGHDGSAPDLARRAASAVGADATVEALLRHLGPRSRVWGIGCGPDLVEISWQLDRDVDPVALLGPVDLADAWTAGRASLDAALGGRGTSRGPWSVAVLMGRNGSVLPRIGTTAWARLPDDDEKIGRLAGWLAGLGADTGTVRRLYRRLTGGAAPPRLPVGRALEVDVDGGTVVAAHAYLSLPTPPVEGTPS